jgi:Flp pilus assembly protein TadB
MPLSEHEERILAQIERQLEQDDPRFVSRARRSRRRGGPWQLWAAAAAFVVGFLCLLGLVLHIAFGFVGFTLMFAAVVVAVPELQRRREQRAASSPTRQQ